MALNRLADGDAVYKQAETRRLGGGPTEVARYLLAFVEGDTARMTKIAASLASQAGFDRTALSMESDTEAYFGRLETAREFSRRAADTALREGETESAAYVEAKAALREVLFGNSAAARRYVRAALTPSVGRRSSGGDLDAGARGRPGTGREPDE